jgi:hypothetical protein
MTTVMIDNNSLTGRRLLKEIEKHPRIARVVDDTFEQDWNQAISGDELVKRVHNHIDELYVQAEK